MNHEEFAAECPTLDFTVARRLCEAHGAEIDEYADQAIGTIHAVTMFGKCNTLDLCRWLGY